MIQNFISKLSPQEKKIFYAAFAVVLLAFLDRLFIGPTMSKLKSLDEDIAQQENVIKSDLRLLSYQDKILKENSDFSVFYVKKARAAEEVIAEFLKIIEMLATESKVNLVKINPADSKEKKGFIEYYADLECDGSLENITKFMYAIDSSMHLLRVVKFGMSPKKSGSDEVVANMTVTKVIVDSPTEEDEQLVQEYLSRDIGVVMKEMDSDKAGRNLTGGDAFGKTANTSEAASKSNVSQRYKVKGLKSDQKKEDTKQQEEEEIKPSVWEKIMQKEASEAPANEELIGTNKAVSGP